MDLSFTYRAWQDDFAAITDSLYRICRKVLRLRPASADRDNDAQEAVCLAMDRFRKLHARGLAHLCTPGTLARYAMADVRRRRRFAGVGDGKRGKTRRDALDVAASDELSLAGTPGRASDPAIAVAVTDWLGALRGRAAAVASGIIDGLDGQQIAARIGVSPATVSIARRELAAAWGGRENFPRIC